MVTDLDGTLLDGQSRLSAGNRRALDELARAGVARMITTGRSLYSARKVLTDDFPIDYLSVSSGSTTLAWRDQELLDRHDMSVEQASKAITALLSHGVDFMIHRAAPDNHRFDYHRVLADNPDFARRIDRYQEYARPWDRAHPQQPICQLLAVEPPESESVYQQLVSELSFLNVVLTTSPLDHASRWIEIFPPQVSKGRSAQSVAARLEITEARVFAIGNDYNDRDLLEWASRSFVVANAPAELRDRYTVVASNDDDGFAEAASLVLESL
jgi:Cof subfamily protein (haloacid dehalogenase superfamily)